MSPAQPFSAVNFGRRRSDGRILTASRKHAVKLIPQATVMDKARALAEYEAWKAQL